MVSELGWQLVHITIKKKDPKRKGQIWVGEMAADKGEVKLEKFDGNDFGFWKM